MQTLTTFGGELSCGWDLFAGNTFNRNTYERGINNQGLDFNTHPPEQMQRLWTTYPLSGARSAFTPGGGVNTQSACNHKIGSVGITALGLPCGAVMCATRSTGSGRPR